MLLARALRVAAPRPLARAFAAPPQAVSQFRTPTPFHLAIPVHDLDAARAFYGGVLGCAEGRSSKTWIDYNLGGAQVVCHFANKEYRARDYFNGVDVE